ncbi:MAG: hypothetical protein IPL31_04415 [Saprospiraceae bacterium]|nr:hypothetical protein [Saprospiraceae bacterium]
MTFTAPEGLGNASITGPGDLASVNLEGVLIFDGGDNQNWTISNMEFKEFDLSIGMFNGAGGSDAYNNLTITNNTFNIATDLNTVVVPRCKPKTSESIIHLARIKQFPIIHLMYRRWSE